MKTASYFKRLLCVLLAVVLMVGNVLPGYALSTHAEEHDHDHTSGSQSVDFVPVDNGEVSASLTPGGRTENGSDALYADTDMVRVSIVLSKKSTISAGFDVMGIGSNQAAVNYRESLKQHQMTMASRIERVIQRELDVVWNLTLVANIISANVPYGQIRNIEKLIGVEAVILENQYQPCETENGTVAPNMATSGAQIGTAPVWAEGYTGAGTRIAVIDTGIDTDHQSLNPLAFEYSLAQLAAGKNMTAEEYIAGLDLLTAEKIAEVAGKLNVTVDPTKAYVNSKIAFAYNYRDNDYDVTHDNDEEGDHGSHVAGIATANSWLASADGTTFGKAIDTAFMQGVAPDAQLLALKVFGKNGSPYDSDFFAAIEDAIVLGADAINLSLGSTAPGRAHHTNPQLQAVMDSLTKSGVVVSISAGNAGAWAESASNGGYLYNTDVSLDTLSQPGAFTNSLCVASVENDGMVGYYFTVGDETIVYIEELFDETAMESFTTLAGEHEYIFIDGVGKEEDWAALGDVLEGKIAFCSRGEINFVDKAKNAVKYGALATVIYNNVNGIIYMDLKEYPEKEPAVFVTKQQSDIIRGKSTPVCDDEGNVLYYTGTMNISSGVGQGVFNSEYYVMSDFSSWGVTGSLEMKPEITAPGGNIFSIEGLHPSGGAYAIKSGTSMAAPQVAGMSALLVQYIRENELDKKTGMDVRHLAQSLLMSTAVPILAGENNYFSILQQGAGLANINHAIHADSYITMAEGSSKGAADGKVKVELFDDPERVGSYSASFTVHNLQNVAKELELNADFFIQATLSDGEFLYMDTATTMAAMDVVWYVDGAMVVPAGLDGLDFNGDGKVSASDGQLLLDYATGVDVTLINRDKADVDDDGDIDSHDAYAFLSKLVGVTATLPANGAAEISVQFSLTEELRETLTENYPNGTYIEGYLFAETGSTEEGAAGTTHSIPVLGFFGNWTDPSMFEVGQWTTFATEEDTRIPYTGVTRANEFKVRYAKDPNYHYSFGGNPLIADSVYMPERNSFNNKDYFHGVGFTPIRHADQSRILIRNLTADTVLLNQKTGAVNMAYYPNEVYGWQNANMTLETNVNMKNTKEGDKISVEFTLVPEYYIDSEGNVDWDALGDGATMGTTFVIDNTAPELKGVSIDYLNNTMTITASDNRYVAAAGIYNKTGTRCLASVGAKQDIKEGETATYTFSLDGVNGKKFLVQVFDYAMNVSTYMLEAKIGEEAGVADMMAFDLVSWHWTTFTKDFEYNYKVGTPRLAYSDHVYYAATIAEHYVFASTSKGELYVMPEDDLTDTTFIVNLGTILYDMAYNKDDGEIYAVTEANELVTINKLTGKMTRVGKIGVKTNTLACDADGVFYCNELGTGKVYSFTLDTMSAPKLLMEDLYLIEESPFGGSMGGTTGNMGMEYDPNTGMICWNSHCEIAYGSYITVAHYYEIDPKTGEFTRYNDFWHEMSCLMIPDETGRSSDWAEPTDEVMGVSMNKSTLHMIKGTTAQLTANVQPWTATDRDVTWTSANPDVAVVDQNGVITALTPGKATIIATSKLDPTKTASCQVTVELLYVTLHGTVVDENNQSMFYSWNMAEAETWTGGNSIPQIMASATWSDGIKAFYMMDTTEAEQIHKVGADGTILASAPNENGIPLWDMAYSDYFSAENKERVTSIYYSYLLSAKDPMALDAVGFDLGDMCNYLVGITTLGYEKVSDETGTEYDTEHLILLDDDGYIWDFWVYSVDREDGEEGYNALFNITRTTLKCEFPGDTTMEHMFTSLMAGEDGNLYLSTYTGETNEIYQLAYDEVDRLYAAVKIGDMGKDVWPATITSVTLNGGESDTAARHPAPAYTMSATEISREQLAAASASRNVSKAPYTVNAAERETKLNLLNGGEIGTCADGTKNDPISLVEGENTGTAPTSGSDKHCYFTYTAIADGKITVSSKYEAGVADWRATVYVNDVVKGNTVHNPKWDGDTITQDVSAGDVFLLKIAPYSGFSAVGGPITVNFHFEPVGGTTPDPEPTPTPDPEPTPTPEPECEHTNTELRNGKPATCTVDGYTGDKYCKDCGELLENGTAIPAPGHTPGAAATCTEPQICTVCETVLAPAAHTPGTAATCTEPQVCTVCGAELAPATGHNYVDGSCTKCGEADPSSTDTLKLGENTGLTSGEVYTYTATEDCRLEFDFSAPVSSAGKVIYLYQYGTGTYVDIMVNGKRLAALENTRVSVKQGQTVTVELVSVDGNTYTADLTLSRLDAAAQLVIGDNAIAKDADYSFIADRDGTLYTTIKELWCDGIYCTAASLSSSVVFRINGTVVYSFNNSYEVKTGDEITILLGTQFDESASAVLNLSYEAFYEHPLGSRGNPYTLNYSDCPTDSVEIPAGTAVWYKLYGFSEDSYLTVEGANAYLIISGTKYKSADGKLTVPAVLSLQIGNDGSAPATFRFSVSATEGTEYNPKDLVEGDNTTTLDKSGNYYYDFVARKPGTATFTVSGENWRFWYSLKNADGTFVVKEEDHRARREDAATVTVELAVGQSIVIKLGTLNDSFMAPGGEITVNFHFVPDGGLEDCEHINRNEPVTENNVDPTCTKDGSYDTVVYCADCGAEVSRTTTTVDKLGHDPGDEATCTSAQLCKRCSGIVTPALGHDFVEGVCSRCGALEADNALALGVNNLISGNVYTYLVTENGRLEFDFVLRDAGGNLIYQYGYGHGTQVKIVIDGVYAPNLEDTKITVTKGQTVTVELYSVDGNNYSAELTLTAIEAATPLNLGDNNISKDKDYSFIATQDGTLYTTIKELWYDSTYCTEASLSSTVVFRINGVAVYSFNNAYEVKAGDEITVRAGLSFGSDSVRAVLYLSYEGFYVHPAGSRGNPYSLSYADCPTDSAMIPAGTTVWYKLYGFGSGYYLTVTGENAYLDINGKKYYPENGSITVPATTNLQIGNAGTSNATFRLSAYITEGYPDNPKDLVDGENSVVLPERGNYWYDFVAPANGEATFTVSGENWGYLYTVYGADGEVIGGIDDMLYEYKGNEGIVTLNLTTGQRVVVKLGTMNSEWQPVGGEVTVTFRFHADGTCTHVNAAGTWTYDDNVDPDHHWQICDSCGESFNRGTHEYENGECITCHKPDPTSTCEHSYGGWVDGKKVCSKCGYVFVCAHRNTRLENKKDATCTEEGYTGDKICNECGKQTETGKTIPATGHNYQEGVCGSCGAVDPDYRHVVGEDVTADVDATNGVVSVSWDAEKMVLVGFEINGDYRSVMKGEGAMTFGYVAVEGIPAGEALATLYFEVVNPADSLLTVSHRQINNVRYDICKHEGGATEPVKENEVAPTCTEGGSYDSVVYCAKCGEEISRETVPVSATGHSHEQVRFRWSEDLSSATAVAACHCGDEIEVTGTVIWDNSDPCKLVVTAFVMVGEIPFTDSRTITASVEADSITVTLPAGVSGMKVFAAVYSDDGQMLSIDGKEVTGETVTLEVSGDNISLFFLNDIYGPISSPMVID